MDKKRIQIVAFDVPFPADYGGVVDVFYKLKALHRAGYKITLHCYAYGRKPSRELENLCEEVFYYRRNLNLWGLFSGMPYIVCSRNSHILLNRLLDREGIILFEGLHSCFFLNHPQLADRIRIVRTHNIEHEYYSSLARSESHLMKKIYFRWEAKRLKNFEPVLKHATAIAAISYADARHFKQLNPSTHTVSAFHSFEDVTLAEKKGNYSLYHGNLAVAENRMAALYLVREVFNDLNQKLIIAGSNPSTELEREIALHENIELIANPDTENLHRLVAEAATNILPTFQATGIKLKLLAALFSGRHVLVNTPMIENTGLESLCYCADTPQEMKKAVIELAERSFGPADLNQRRSILANGFSNAAQFNKLEKMFSPQLSAELVS